MIIFSLAFILGFKLALAAIEWGNDVRLTYTGEDSYVYGIAVDSFNNSHIIVKEQNSTTYNRLLYLKIKNNGIILVNKTLDGGSLINYPTITLDSNDSVHIVYNGLGALRYTKLDNNGTVLINKSLEKLSGDASIDTDSNDNIIIAYLFEEDGTGNDYINVTIIDNNGNEIKTYGFNRTNYAAQAGYASVAVDNSDVIHVVWSDALNPSTMAGDLAYGQIKNGSVSNVIILTNDTSRYPKIDTDSSNNPHIVWDDRRYFGTLGYEIFYTKLDNNGTTVVDDIDLTNHTDYSMNGNLVVDQYDNVHVVWSDNRDGNYELYYAKLDNNGNKLVSDTRLTSDTFTDFTSNFGFSIAFNPNDQNVYLAWHKNIDSYEVYYKKSNSSLDVITNHTASDDTIIPGVIGEEGIAKIIYKIIPTNFSGSVYMDVYDENDTLFYHKDIIYTPVWSTAIWDGSDGKGIYVEPANYTIKITAIT